MVVLDVSSLPPGKTAVEIGQMAGCDPEPVWTGVEEIKISYPADAQATKPPSCSELLYRLSCRGHYTAETDLL